MEEIKFKQCNCCKEIKPITEFNIDNKRKDGLYIYCKECSRRKFREYYAKNIEKIKKRTNSEKYRIKRNTYENSPKRKEYRRKLFQKYYIEHKEQMKQSLRDILTRRYKLLEDLGLLTDCIICGFPKEKRQAMHFHHINPKEKEINIGLIIQRIKKYPDEKLIQEAKKCVCMCANCHMLYHGKDEEIIKKYNEVINNIN